MRHQGYTFPDSEQDSGKEIRAYNKKKNIYAMFHKIKKKMLHEFSGVPLKSLILGKCMFVILFIGDRIKYCLFFLYRIIIGVSPGLPDKVRFF